jgi:FixJ family two-component response regulator
MAIERSLVSVLDDDESVRESLPFLLAEFGYATRAFTSAEEFLGSDVISQTNCLILDVMMPGMTRIELQCELKDRGQDLPLVFITANRDDSLRRRVLAQGAVDCLQKPFSDTALYNALQSARRKN